MCSRPVSCSVGVMRNTPLSTAFPHEYPSGFARCRQCQVLRRKVEEGAASDNCDVRQELAAKADPVTEAPGDE